MGYVSEGMLTNKTHRMQNKHLTPPAVSMQIHMLYRPSIYRPAPTSLLSHLSVAQSICLVSRGSLACCSGSSSVSTDPPADRAMQRYRWPPASPQPQGRHFLNVAVCSNGPLIRDLLECTAVRNIYSLALQECDARDLSCNSIKPH